MEIPNIYVVNVCSHDWANYSYDNMRALRSVGIYCNSFKSHAHKFNYREESIVVNKNYLFAQIEKADMVQIMHSDYRMLDLCIMANQKNIIVYHTGTGYRQKSARYNALFNPHVTKSVIALGEFSGLGAKNEYYCSVAVDTDLIRPADSELKKPYTIGHYPSSTRVKGSDVIVSVVKSIHKKRNDFNFFMTSDFIPRKEYIEKLRMCDIYIELFALEQDGYKYGSWGTTAVEAAALGKIVITNHTTEKVYKKYYGTKTPFYIANTRAELRAQINKVLNFSKEIMLQKKREAREWAKRFHSYDAVGKYLLKNVINGL